MAQQPLFHTPAGLVVCGPTMSGKTQFVFELLKNPNKVFSKPPKRIVYCYGEWQTGFQDLASSVHFVNGLGPVLEDENYFDPKIPTLLVIDDLAVSVSNDSKCTKLFTQGIHHRNLSVILILQNLYKQGKSMRDIALNAQYLVLFKNVRDTSQITVLARQMGLPHLVDAYRKVTAEPFQPIVIDMKPETPDYLRVRSHVLPGQITRIYVKRFSTVPCLNV
jgi:hypothetical protein